MPPPKSRNWKGSYELEQVEGKWKQLLGNGKVREKVGQRLDRQGDLEVIHGKARSGWSAKIQETLRHRQGRSAKKQVDEYFTNMKDPGDRRSATTKGNAGAGPVISKSQAGLVG